MMGISPDQAARLSLWHYSLCLKEWNQRHGGAEGPGGKPMSIDRMRELGIEGV